MSKDRRNGAAGSGCEEHDCAHLSCGTAATRNAINLGRRDFLKDALAATAGFAGIGVLGGCAAPVTQETNPADTIIAKARIASGTIGGRRSMRRKSRRFANRESSAIPESGVKAAAAGRCR